MTASILLLNPNRHRASDKLTKSANRNPVENNMRRDTNKCKSKSPVKEKPKTNLDFSDLLIENALVLIEFGANFPDGRRHGRYPQTGFRDGPSRFNCNGLS
jgi:hypothetical protein